MLSKNVNKTLNILNKQIGGMKNKLGLKNFFTLNKNLSGVAVNASLPGLKFSRRNFSEEKTIDVNETPEIIKKASGSKLKLRNC